jgi:hypothetical protein
MRFPLLQRAALGPLLLVIVIALLLLSHRPPARPTIAPPWAVSNSLPGEWMDVPEINLPDVPDLPLDPVLPRSDLEVFSTSGLYETNEREALASELEQALAYTAHRFGGAPSERIIASVQDNPGCALHGVALTSERRVEVFTCADIPRRRVVNIMAHEFVHQLAHDYYGPRHLKADMILLEGLATWGAGDYWLNGHPDFRAFVHHHYLQSEDEEDGEDKEAADTLLPLATSYVGRPISDMNQLYYQWASFVEYLLETYGRDHFDQIYMTGERAPGSANYAVIYGRDLATLEQAWRAWLAAE